MKEWYAFTVGMAFDGAQANFTMYEDLYGAISYYMSWINARMNLCYANDSWPIFTQILFEKNLCIAKVVSVRRVRESRPEFWTR
jgi:hypothetical protein